MSLSIIRSPTVPSGAVQVFQNDGAGAVYAAIAHTQWGDIPGKAQGNNCWFPYGGEEKCTNDFSWVVGSGFRLVRGLRFVPSDALPLGLQNDGAGPLWVAVAHTQWGDIPGKTDVQGNDCWFPYGGKEHCTNNFSWVVV